MRQDNSTNAEHCKETITCEKKNETISPDIADCNSDDPPSNDPNSMDSRNLAPGASLGKESKIPPPLAKEYSLPNISTPLWWRPMPILCTPLVKE